MILIADSGSTKTAWCLAENGRAERCVTTQGINPFHQDMATISTIVTSELMPLLEGASPAAVFFYGSGCRANKIEAMEQLLAKAFPSAKRVEAHGDLLAAARAVCGRSMGMAAILGTGANSCLYDGREIVMNTPPMGYILGDEGSGAVLGRLFVNALFKGFLPKTVADGFLADTKLTLDSLIERVYREPLANRYLASLSPHILKWADCEEVRTIIIDNFRNFFRRNVAAYSRNAAVYGGNAAIYGGNTADNGSRNAAIYGGNAAVYGGNAANNGSRNDLSIGAVGSIAYHYSAFLTEAAAAEGYTMGKIMQSPMPGLVDYHAVED